MTKRKYYVYALLDPRLPGDYSYGKYKFDYEPFYIGKGTGSRAQQHYSWIHRLDGDYTKLPKAHRGNTYKLTKILNIYRDLGEYPKIQILHRLASNARILALEVEAIATIGRHYKGPLTNLTDGGEGNVGRTGWEHSKSSKRKNARSNKLAYAKLPKSEKKRRQEVRAERRLARTPEHQARVSESARHSVTAFWNGNKNAIEERNRHIAETQKAKYAALSDLDKVMLTCRRALPGLVNRFHLLPDDKVEPFKLYVIRKMEKYFQCNTDKKWADVKPKIVRSYKRFLAGTISLC